LSGGLPAFTIVGMAETAVRESKDRVRGVLMSSGFDFSHQRLLRVSWTIGDLAGDKKIAPPHIAEALSLRCLDWA
jgi:magnesium chelatase family protein